MTTYATAALPPGTTRPVAPRTPTAAVLYAVKFLHEKLNQVQSTTLKNPKFQQLLKWLHQLAT